MINPSFFRINEGNFNRILATLKNIADGINTKKNNGSNAKVIIV